MRRNALIRGAIALTVGLSMVALTACGGGAKIPETYQYEDLTKYIKVGNYEGLHYDKTEVDVTSAEVQEAVNSVLDSSTTEKEVREGTVEADDVVKINYEGKIDGKAFDGGTAEDYELDLADSNFIDGFAEQIVGHQVGETFDINVTFPADYSVNQDMAGKDAVFTIKVNAIVENETPEYNDAFVKKSTNGQYTNTKDYEKHLRKQLLKNKKEQAKSQERNQVFQQILQNSEVKKYPDKEYNDAVKKMKSTYKKLAQQNDMDYETFLQTNLGMSKAEFNAQCEESAKNSVKQQLVLRQLAKELEIEISDSEYDDYLQKLLKDAGYTEDQYEAASGMTIEKYAEENNLYDTMLYENVMDKVMSKAVAN